MHPLLKKVIKERFGKLNRLQQDAFREVSSGKSVLIIAPTGSAERPKPLFCPFSTKSSRRG